jgi:hypothetical protein
MQNDNSHYLKITITKENSIRGLLLALELEPASAILKMSLFYSILTLSEFLLYHQLAHLASIALFFVGIFSVRIAML